MKKELLQRFAEALSKEEFDEMKKEVIEVRKLYEQESEKIDAARKEEYRKQNDEVIFYNPVKDPEDGKFEELNTKFRLLEKERREKEEAERAAKAARKKELLAKLTELTQAGSGLGVAFDQYNAIHDEWKALGFMEGPEGKEIQKQFNHQVDIFFYTVDMTKQMREMDYEKNLVEKKELITRLPAIMAVESIKEREKQLRKIQSDFNSVGPVPFAVKDEINTGFRGGSQDIYDSIQAHFDERRAEYDDKLKLKIALCEKLNGLCQEFPDKVGEWNKMTEEIIVLQKEWREIGYSSENETVWGVFRQSCDHFFNSKRAYYDKVNEERDRNAGIKKDLIQKAESVKEDTNWKQTTEYLIGLQKTWKEVGPSRRSDEQKLWNAFRGACNHFFEAKKAHFADQDAANEDNLVLKNALIEKIEKFEFAEDREENFQALKAFSGEWSAIGFVPRKDKDKIYKRYHEALDAKYDALKVARDKRYAMQFESKLESMQQAGDTGSADSLIISEKRNLRTQIQRIETDISTYENNMGFFGKSNAKSNKPNPLIADIEQKIKRLRGEAGDLRRKLDMLPKAKKD